MQRSTDRIRTTHVGSLPRPQRLSELLLEREFGSAIDPQEYRQLTDEAVTEAVRRQVAAGVDVVSDGEMSKIGYATYIVDRCSGFSGESPRVPPADLERFPEYLQRSAREGQAPRIARRACTGPIQVVDRAPLTDDLARFRTALDASGASEGFVNAASPGVISAFLPNQYYPGEEAYLEALAAVLREEYEAIHQAGFIVQVDCPDLAMARHIWYKAESDADFVKRAERHVAVLNAALERVPADRARMHICWGNYEGPHDCDVPLATIAEVLCRAKPQAILLEAANPRHGHEWAVWKDVALPDDKLLVPGVIDSTSNFIEHPEYVADRICRYADVVGRERVMAGSDCGFGTFAQYGRVDAEITYAKLETLARGAEIASARLW